MGLRIPSINRHNHTAKKIEQYEESLAVGEELEIVCYTQEGSDIKYFIDDKEVDDVSTLDLVWDHPIDIWLTITDLCAEHPILRHLNILRLKIYEMPEQKFLDFLTFYFAGGWNRLHKRRGDYFQDEIVENSG